MMFLSKASLAFDTGLQNSTLLPELTEYGIHQEIWRLFPGTPAGSRPFLFRKEDASGKPYFFILSGDRPKASGPHWLIQSKEFDPQIRKGEKMRFALRANPIISRHDANGKSRRHDVIMHAKFLERQKNAKITDPSGLERRIALDWLGTRASEHGFSFRNPDVQVFGYRRLMVRKPAAKEAIKLSVIEFEGILEVVEPTAFQQTLREGIGPGKGFGCGLLLVRRA